MLVMRWSGGNNEVMKRPLLASMAAVLVSSALIVSPAAAVETSTSESVLSPTVQLQPSYKSGGELSTMGLGSGSQTYWCNYWGWFC
jgi:hypothetical protein